MSPLRPVRSRPLRILLAGAGLLALGLGILGIVLPLVPTTPFVLLAAGCFARSSPRLHHWLRNHRWFGPPLVRWEETGTVSRRARNTAVLLIVLTMTPTIVWVIPLWWVKVLVAAIGASVITWLLRLPLSDDLPEDAWAAQAARRP